VAGSVPHEPLFVAFTKFTSSPVMSSSSDPQPVAHKPKAPARFLASVAAAAESKGVGPAVPRVSFVPSVSMQKPEQNPAVQPAKPAPTRLARAAAEPTTVPPVNAGVPPVAALVSAAPSPFVDGVIPQIFMDYVDSVIDAMRETQREADITMYERLDAQYETIDEMSAKLQASEDRYAVLHCDHEKLVKGFKSGLEAFDAAFQLQFQASVDTTKARVATLEDEFDEKLAVVRVSVTTLGGEVDKKLAVVRDSVTTLGGEVDKKLVDVRDSVTALEGDVNANVDQVTALDAIVQENQGKSALVAQNQSALHASVLAMHDLLVFVLGQQAIHANTLERVDTSVDVTLSSISAIVRESAMRARVFDSFYDLVHSEIEAITNNRAQTEFLVEKFILDHGADYASMGVALTEGEANAAAVAQDAIAMWEKERAEMDTRNATEQAAVVVQTTKKVTEAFALSLTFSADSTRMRQDFSDAISGFQVSTTLAVALPSTLSPAAAPAAAPPAASAAAPAAGAGPSTALLAGAGAAPVAAAPLAAPPAALAAAPAAALAAAPLAAPPAALAAAPLAAPPAAPLAAPPAAPPAALAAAADTSTTATKIAVKGSDSVFEALGKINSGDAHEENARELETALVTACDPIYEAIVQKTRAAGGSAVLDKALKNSALKAMLFTPEKFDAAKFDAMHKGTTKKIIPSGGFCIQEGKTIEEIMDKLGKCSSIADMNPAKRGTRNRIFTLYVQQFMASNDKIALAILDLFEVSP
jgi:hypothetical protein